MNKEQQKEIIKNFVDNIRKYTRLTSEMEFTFDMLDDNGNIMKDNHIYIRLNKAFDDQFLFDKSEDLK